MSQNNKILSIAAGGLLSVLAATGTAVVAGEPAKANLGPVGPYEPILATVGGSRLVAYYQPESGKCAVSAVMFTTAPNGGGAKSARVSVALRPGELFRFDGAGGDRAVLTCGPDAKALTVLNPGEILTKSANKALY